MTRAFNWKRALVAICRFCWAVFVGLVDVARHLVLIIIAAAFGWRFGSRP